MLNIGLGELLICSLIMGGGVVALVLLLKKPGPPR